MEGPCRKVPAGRCGRARSTRDLEPVFGTSPDDGKLSSDRLGRVSSPAVLVVVVFDKTDVLVIAISVAQRARAGSRLGFNRANHFTFFRLTWLSGSSEVAGQGSRLLTAIYFFGFFGFMAPSIERSCSIHRPTHARPNWPIARRCGHSFAVQRWPSS